MPSRGKIPPFLVLLIVGFVVFGLVGFQTLKERRTANAALSAKDSEIETIEIKLKEQVKTTYKAQEQIDHMKTQLTELQRVSDAATESLRAKEKELYTLRTEHQQKLEELRQLRAVLDQKEGEIVNVRSQLQDFSFQKAKESAELIKKEEAVGEAAVEVRHDDDTKPADETALDDRKRIDEEEEDAQAIKETDVSATEKEMDERSKPKDGMGRLTEDVKDQGDDKLEESMKAEGLQDEEAEEQDNADARDPDEKENDPGQDDELNEDSKGLQSGDHDREVTQSAEHFAN